MRGEHAKIYHRVLQVTRNESAEYSIEFTTNVDEHERVIPRKSICRPVKDTLQYQKSEMSRLAKDL